MALLTSFANGRLDGERDARGGVGMDRVGYFFCFRGDFLLMALGAKKSIGLLRVPVRRMAAHCVVFWRLGESSDCKA